MAAQPDRFGFARSLGQRTLRLIHGIVREMTRRITRRAIRNSEGALIGLCVPLGAIVGLLVVAMHSLVSWLHVVDFGLPAGATLSAGQGIDPWHLAVVPALGGAILSGFTFLMRKFRPREIVDPIEANAIRGGRMSLIDSTNLAVATILSNSSGASLGMEAAYSQSGSGILSFIGQILRLRREDQRIFVAAGAAAAIAAAFNAPLAGAFYAFELVLGSYSPAALAQVAMASLSGTLAMRATIGQAPIFLVHAPPMAVHRLDFALFLLMGALAAVIGIANMRAATGAERLLRRLRLPLWLHPAIGGACLSAIAFVHPQVLGSGHGAIQALFDHVPGAMVLMGLLLAKMLASAISLGAGFRGGLFSSSLYLGCLFGAALAGIEGWFGPWADGQDSLYMMVGMGAVAASIVGAPVTMVLLVLEMTGDLEVAIGVLAGVITAATITRHAFGYSFATWRFHQQGKAIRSAHDIGWISELTVARLARSDVTTVPHGMPLEQLRQLIPLGSRNPVFAVDQAGGYEGMIEPALVHDHDLDDAAPGLVAGDLAAGRHDVLYPEMDIKTAIARLGEAEREFLPVLAGREDRRVVGTVSEAYALRRYAQEMEERRNAELGERHLLDIGPL